MNEPLALDEGPDTLGQFRRVFREVLIRHRASRLELFYLLQFPDAMASSIGLPSVLDPMNDLESAAPATVRQYRLEPISKIST